MSNIEDNKDLVRRFYAEAINDRDRDAVDRLLSEDSTHDGELRGRAGQKQAVAAFADAFSDLHNEIWGRSSRIAHVLLVCRSTC